MLEGAAENAAQYKINAYYTIPKQNHDLIKKALLKETLWTSFRVHRHFYYTPKSGIVDSEKYLASDNVGGHAVAMTGWKIIDGDLYWEFQNSWGTSFGDRGFFYLESSLYEQVLINNYGPVYIETKSETNQAEEERRKKEAEERRQQEEKDKQKKKKSLLMAILGFGGMALLGWLTKYL